MISLNYQKVLENRSSSIGSRSTLHELGSKSNIEEPRYRINPSVLANEAQGGYV